MREYSVTVLFVGEILPIWFLEFSVNQIFPSGPAAIILAIGPTIGVVVPGVVKKVVDVEGIVEEAVPVVVLALHALNAEPKPISRTKNKQVVLFICSQVYS